MKRRRTRKVPFGIRALEQGVEVEGIWHSKATTPNPSLPSSPTITPSEPAHQHHESRSGASSAATSPELRARDLLAPASALAAQKPPSIHQHYKPRRSSGLRFSNAQDDVLHNSFHPSRPPSQQTLSRSPASSSSASASPASTPLDPVYAIPNANVSGESNPFLTPTSTRKSLDADVEAVPLQQLGGLVPTGLGLVDQNDYHSQLLTAAELAYQDNHHHNLPTGQTAAHEPRTLHRAAAFSFEDLHDPSPHHFDHEASAPLSESLLHSSNHRAPVSLPSTPSAATSTSRPQSMIPHPTSASSNPPAQSTSTTRPPSSRPPSFTAEKRHSNVIRKINSGFEILRPGTLDAAAPSGGSANGSGGSGSGGVRQSGEWLGDREGKKEKRGRLVKKRGRDSLI